MVYWGPLWRQRLDIGLWCPSSISTSKMSNHCLTSISTLLRTPNLGSSEWVGLSQWWLLLTFVHTECKSGMSICFIRIIGSCNPQILLLRCDSRCPRIGSLELSMVCCMSNLKFDYLEPGIMIIYWNWDVFVQYCLSFKQ